MKRSYSAEGIMAHAGSWLSRISVEFPQSIGRLVNGDDPRLHAVGYYVASLSTSDIPESSWAEFDGDSEAPKIALPVRAQTVGIIAVNQVALSEVKAERPKAKPAVAWALGEHVLAARIPAGDKHPDTFAMRRLHGPLQATAGWIDHEGLHVPPEAVTALATIDLAELPRMTPLY